MGIDFCSAVFQKAADFSRMAQRQARVLCSDRLGRREQRAADARGVLVQDKDSEGLAENHPGQDQGNSANREQLFRTHDSTPSRARGENNASARSAVNA